MLFITVAAAGGGYRTRRTMFWNRIVYSGGAIAEYLLFSTRGEIVAARTLRDYTGFAKVEKPHEQKKDDLTDLNA